jgi:hypothetical protein
MSSSTGLQTYFSLVAQQGARQQARLAQHLEAVADADDGHAVIGGLDFTACMIGAWAAMAPQRR